MMSSYVNSCLHVRRRQVSAQQSVGKEQVLLHVSTWTRKHSIGHGRKVHMCDDHLKCYSKCYMSKYQMGVNVSKTIAQDNSFHCVHCSISRKNCYALNKTPAHLRPCFSRK